MYSINNFNLLYTDHRPWPLPTGNWAYYQEWNNALFLHWKVPAEDLVPLIPANLTLDLHDNCAWVSLVAFSMEKIRPRGIPSLSAVSNFLEINVRTYVTKDNKPGVYFLNIEADKYLSVLIARYLSGLPYEQAAVKKHFMHLGFFYSSENKKKGFKLSTGFDVREPIVNGTVLDQWLTERYCLYLDTKGSLYRYEIHHRPWKLHTISFQDVEADYRISNLSLNGTPHLAHYSNGVQVLAWKREKV